MTSLTAALDSPASTIHKEPAPLGWPDAVWICAVLVLMGFFSYVHSRGLMFWSDELMGWLVIREKTITGMVHSWQGGLDSGSLLYIFGGRWWMDIFGPSEISLRAFSAAGVAASFVALWVCARRYFSVVVVGLGLSLTFFMNQTLDWQFENARMYGGFLLATALVSYAFLEAGPNRPLTWRVLLLTFGAHFLLMCGHTLGPMYSGIFIAGLVAQDLWARQFRLKLYLSAFASWVVLLVSYKNIQGTIALGKPVYFTVKPTLADLSLGLFVYSSQLRKFTLLMVVAAVLMTLLLRRRPIMQADGPSRTPLYFLLGSYAAIVLVSFAISQITTSIFLDRYLLPIVLGDALLVCFLVDLAMKPLAPYRFLRYAAVGLGLLLFVRLYRQQFRFPFGLPVPNYTAKLLAQVPPGFPMVITNSAIFSEMSFYQSAHAIMLMPVDWSINLDPDAGVMAQAGAHEMDNWKMAGYYADRILPTGEILARFPNFLLLQDSGHTLWFRRYILHNPRYRVTSRGLFNGYELWLVETRT